MKPTPLFAATAAACVAVFANGCATSLATLEGPDDRQRLGQPAPVSVTLKPSADPATFRAAIDGRDVTDAFRFDEDQSHAQLDGFIFQPTPGQQPHTLTVRTAPALNAKGRPLGQTFEQTLTFFPPAITLQGNVGMGDHSHVKLAVDGRSSVMVRLPVAALNPTTLTVTPTSDEPGEMTDGIALNDQTPGKPIQVTINPGSRVAVFDLYGHRPGLTELRVEAPGYVSDDIEVRVDGPASTPTAAAAFR